MNIIMALNLTMYRITKNIYICETAKTSDLDSLETEKIKGMLYLSSKSKDESMLGDYAEMKIQHYHLPMEDSEEDGGNGGDVDFSPYFDRIAKILKHFDDNNSKILVYCTTGARLAPIAVIIYLLYKIHIIDESIPKDEEAVVTLLKEMKQVNRDIDYHNLDKTIQQLVLYEKRLKEKREYNSKLNNSPDNLNVIKIFDQ